MISEEFSNQIWVYFETNLSIKTRKEYWTVLKNFDKITGHDPMHLTNEDAMSYYHYLLDRINNDKLSYSTAVMRMSVMRSLCNFIEHYNKNHGKSYKNYFREISIPEQDKTITQQDIPTVEEVNALLSAAKDNHDNKAFLIFALAVKCGFTNTEICSLNYEFFSLDSMGNMCITLPARKQKPSRIIKLPQDIAKLIDAYTIQYQIDSGPIFINKRKTRIKLRDTERLLAKYTEICLKDNKIRKHYTIQALRHAAFSYMLRGGSSKEQTAHYGGISTKWMGRYDRIVTSETIEQAIDFSIISIHI